MTDRPTYSFSRISFECGHSFYRRYVLKEEGEGNAWSESGSYLHSLCEDVANGKISEQQAAIDYVKGFLGAIEHDFPKFPSGYDLKQHYFKKCLPFFQRKKYWSGDVIAVEKHVVGELPSGAKLQGYIDLMTRNKGKLSLIDHKISKRFTPEQLLKKQRQLYIYAYLLHLETGEYPANLVFNFFQEPSRPIIIPFSEYYMQEAVSWAEERIAYIENMQEEDYIPDINALQENGERGMYCRNLCNFRNSCPYVEGDYFKNTEL